MSAAPSAAELAAIRLELLRAGLAGGQGLGAALDQAQAAWAFVQGEIPPLLMLPAPDAATVRKLEEADELFRPAAASAAEAEPRRARRRAYRKDPPPPRHCEKTDCACLLVRRENETASAFRKRRFCSRPCALAVSIIKARAAMAEQRVAAEPEGTAARDVAPGESWAFTEHRSQAVTPPAATTAPWSDTSRVLPAPPPVAVVPPPLRALPPTPGGGMRFEDDPRARRDAGSPGPISRAVTTHRDSSLA